MSKARQTVRALLPPERAVMEPALQLARQLEAEANIATARARDARAFVSAMVALLNGGNADATVGLDEERWELYRISGAP